MLTEEEVANIKEQLFKQIEKFPEEQREVAKQQVETMDAEQLEEFLEKNKLVKGAEKCLFCSIADGKTFSYKITENKEAIAVLDINPISRGHSLVIPKEHKTIEEIPSALQLAQEVAKKIKTKLKADDVKTETTSVQGHGLINLIPIYKGKKLERKKASEEELQELLKELTTEEATKEIEDERKIREIKETKIEDLPKAPKRMP